MGARVCGASAERDALSASRCWCRGLFCYRRGYKASAEFRRDTRIGVAVPSEEDFRSALGQEDLFAGAAVRDKWLARLEAHAPAGNKRRGRDGDIRRAV